MRNGPVWPQEVEIKVPWRDVDAAGHVNNAVYLSYLETARLEAYLQATGREGIDGIDFIVAHASVDYRSPAFLLETVVVKVWPTRVGNTSFTFEYELREKKTGRLIAEARTVQVMYDWQADKKKPLTPELRKLLEG